MGIIHLSLGLVFSFLLSSTAYADSEWEAPARPRLRSIQKKVQESPEIIEPASSVAPASSATRLPAPSSVSTKAEAPFPHRNSESSAPISESKLIGAAPALPAPSEDLVAVMADFWPIPADEQHIFLRMYDYQGAAGDAPKHLLQKVIFERADKSATYFRVEDWIRDYSSAELKFTWASTWHMKRDVSGEVTEYADSVVVFTPDYRRKLSYLEMNYKKGNEILWGRHFTARSEGALLKGSVFVDEATSFVTNYDVNGAGTRAPYARGTAGYNWVSLLGNYKGYSVKGTSYDPALFKLYQTFCTAEGCGQQSSWEVYVNYYMVKGKGAVRMDYYKREVGETAFTDKGSHLMSNFCEAAPSAIDCP